jgi:solute:Na+ symporter, SSS family
MLAGLDIGIISAYMVIVLGLGLWAKKRASGSIEDYFLGGRHIPWYILGLSGMAAFLDMSGTML